MQLILVRHGIAEDISNVKKDSLRDLTCEGIEIFNAEVPGLLALLNGNSDVQIWHSPTKRTTQTAEIIHKSIPGALCLVKDFIADNDFNKFSESIKNTNLPDVLIIVGHEPGMSFWSKKIAGVNIKFQQ